MSGNLTEIINTMTQVVLFAVPSALILLLFFWNMSQLIFQSNNPEKLKDAHSRIIWSLIGLFVVFSLAGILVVLQNTFFGESNQSGGAVEPTGPTAPEPFGDSSKPKPSTQPSPDKTPLPVGGSDPFSP